MRPTPLCFCRRRRSAARQIADKVERHPGWLPRPSGRIKSHASNAVLLLPKA
jgi:hypothetical protein